MKDQLPAFLIEQKAAILEEWRNDLKEKFGHLEEDSRLWLANELEELFDDITAKLSSADFAAGALQRSEAIAPEIFDSMEFASRIECLLSGMRHIVRYIRELAEKDENMTDADVNELAREIEASLRLQLHDEVQAFCKRWSEKTT